MKGHNNRQDIFENSTYKNIMEMANALPNDFFLKQAGNLINTTIMTKIVSVMVEISKRQMQIIRSEITNKHHLNYLIYLTPSKG